MKLRFYLILVFTGLFIRAFADNTYSNPVLMQDMADPTVIRANDGYFYAIATSGDLPPVYRSKDLVNWSYVRRAFTPTGRPSWEPEAGVWGPDVNYINGKYVMYYAMSVWNGIETCGVGVATSNKPEGPYTDLGKLLRSNEIGVTNSIDPVFFEENGKKYLIWGSFWGGIWVIELNDDGLSIKEGSQKVQIAGTSYFEGSYIHKRGGYYYLFASTGTCCDGANSTYHLVVGRSTSLTGVYRNKTGQKMLDNKYTTVISSNNSFKGTGHCSQIVSDDLGQDWILYHSYMASTPEIGRVLMLSHVQWDNEGWPYVETGTPALSASKPVFRNSDNPSSYKQDFEEAAVGDESIGDVLVINYNPGGGAQWTHSITNGTAALAGEKSACLDILHPGNEWWGLQFKVQDAHLSYVKQGYRYRISFKIKSETPSNYFGFHMEVTCGYSQPVYLPEANVTYPISIESPPMDKSGIANFLWSFGRYTNTGKIWIDDICIEEFEDTVPSFSNYYRANDPKLRYSGRVDVDSNAQTAFMQWSGSSVTARFNGTEAAVVVSGAGVKLDTYIDGIRQPGTYTVPDNTATTLLITRNLTPGEHELTIRKASLTEYPFTFRGIKTNGELLQAIAVNKSLKIEYFGNSISDGYAAAAPDNRYYDYRTYDDAGWSYTCLLSEMLNAEYYNNSIGGIAVCQGTGNGIGMETRFDKLYPLIDNRLWNFSKFIPDICVMALGVNDNDQTSMSWSAWRERYKQIVLKLRQEYGNHTVFLFAVGPMVGPESNSVTHVKILVEELRASGINACSYVYSFTTTTTTQHPNAPEHLQMAKELYNYIRNNQLHTDIVSPKEDQSLFYDRSSHKIKYNNTDALPKTLSVYSAQGERLHVLRNTNNNEWNVSFLKQGIYIIEIDWKDQVVSKKIAVL